MTGAAYADLDVNEVEARLYNTGALFYSGVDAARYGVPKETGVSAIFSANLWIGGQVDGELRVTGLYYGRAEFFQFWPGPLGSGATPPADCSIYDRIYVVSRADVARYLKTGEATADLQDWPVELGAPVLDGDGDPANYDLAGGDQPAIWGSQTAWWIMNDVGNEHVQVGSETTSAPLGVEVRAMAFASGAQTPGGPAARSTFYRYAITNRSTSALDSAYVALFVDPDLGNALDDYVGTDTTLQMGYVYNAAEVDSANGGGYGVPPALGFQIAEGPVGYEGEPLGLTASSCHQKFLERTSFEAKYNCMRGLWGDGTPMTAFGYGYNPAPDPPGPDDSETGGPEDVEGAITRFAYTGDPTQSMFWSEENIDRQGSENPDGDRRLVVSSGPFRLAPGETQTVTFALPFAWSDSRLHSVGLLRAFATETLNAIAQGYLEPRRVEPGEGPEEQPEGPTLPANLIVVRPAPNPFTASLALHYKLPETARVHLALYDVLGRELAVLADGVQEAGAYAPSLDASSWPAGVYLVRFAVGGEAQTFPVTRLR